MRRTAPRRKSLRQPSPPGNPAVRAAILEVVENQLRDNDPPEVRLTLERLVESGYSDQMARTYIGMAVLFEMNEIMRTKAPFGNDRYVSALNQLPHLL